MSLLLVHKDEGCIGHNLANIVGEAKVLLCNMLLSQALVFSLGDAGIFSTGLHLWSTFAHWSHPQCTEEPFPST